VRRTKLIWFALGVASVAITAIVAELVTPAFLQPRIAHLVLVEPVLERDQIRDEDMIANAIGELARDCGARFFETTFLYNDHAPTLEIALTPENQQATECIMSEASQRSIQTNIIYRKATNAQTH
jgi:hypothetical protein